MLDLDIFPKRWLEKIPSSCCDITLFIEGFDNYGPPSTNNPNLIAILNQRWNSGSAQAIVNGLNGISGYAVELANQVLSKTLPGALTRLIGGVRFSVNGLFGSSPVWGMALVNGGTPCCSITCNITTGQFSVLTGGTTGPAIGTSSASITANTTHYLEFDITIGASANAKLWLDGAQILNVTGNTANSQASTNAFQIFSGNGTNSFFDDLYLFDSTGSVNNAALNTNPIAITQFPTNDTQTQWSHVGDALIPAGIAQTSVASLTSTVNAPGANKMLLVRCQAAIAETLGSVKFLPETTSGGANFQPVVYADSAGSRGSILSGGAQVTGSTAGTTLAMPLSGGVSLGAGTFYWIGYFTDTNIAAAQYDNTTNLGETYSGTYGSGSGSFTGGLSTGQPTFLIWGECTGSAKNWVSVDGNPVPGAGPSGTDEQIQSSTANSQDFYSFPTLPSAVATVYCVDIQVNGSGVSGAPSIGCAILSGGTTGYGSLGSGGLAPPSGNFGAIDSYFDVDPHTTGSWSVGSVNIATAGPLLV